MEGEIEKFSRMWKKGGKNQWKWCKEDEKYKERWGKLLLCFFCYSLRVGFLVQCCFWVFNKNWFLWVLLLSTELQQKPLQGRAREKRMVIITQNHEPAPRSKAECPLSIAVWKLAPNYMPLKIISSFSGERIQEGLSQMVHLWVTWYRLWGGSGAGAGGSTSTLSCSLPYWGLGDMAEGWAQWGSFHAPCSSGFLHME